MRRRRSAPTRRPPGWPIPFGFRDKSPWIPGPRNWSRATWRRRCAGYSRTSKPSWRRAAPASMMWSRYRFFWSTWRTSRSSTKSWLNIFASRTRRAPPSAWLHCRAARRSKRSASSPCDRLKTGHGIARRGRFARHAAAHLGRGDDPGPAVPIAAALRGSYAHRSFGRASSWAARLGRGRGSAHRGGISRAPPNAVQDRRWLGLFDAAFFLLHGAAAAGPRARCAGSLFRRGAPRPQGIGVRASGISACRPACSPGAGGASHADLSRYGRPDSGASAPARWAGARPDRPGRSQRLAAAGGARRFAPARLARSLALRASPSHGRAGGFIDELSASRAAPIGVRGVARASAIAQVVAAAHTK